jgi:hypothetical protein
MPSRFMLTAMDDSQGFIAAVSMKDTRKVSDMEARAMVTVPPTFGFTACASSKLRSIA